MGLRRSIVGLLAMVVLVGMGERMAERFLPVYLMALGGGVLSVGLLNGMDNLLGALYSFPGGYLSDRLGTKRALLIFNLISMVGFILVVLVPSWPVVLAAAQARGAHAFLVEDWEAGRPALSDSRWVLVTMNQRLAADRQIASAAVRLEAQCRPTLFTDDYSNIARLVTLE